MDRFDLVSFKFTSSNFSHQHLWLCPSKLYCSVADAGLSSPIYLAELYLVELGFCEYVSGFGSALIL